MKKDKAIFILLVLANTAVLTFESDNADILFFLAFLNLLVCMIYFLDLINFKKDYKSLKELYKRVENLWGDTSDREFKLLEEKHNLIKRQENLCVMLDRTILAAEKFKDINRLRSEIDELRKARKDLSKEAQKINELNR
ncbi:MAG: hypothetical protein KAR07_05155 [Spirochaetes bacterium]|nr:hypothetical protein [Spirochaetota bacterium]